MPEVLVVDGKKLASMETFVTVNVHQRSDNSDAGVPIRGLAPESFLVRPRIKIVSGRNIEFGKYEMLGGVSAANQFTGVDLNRTINIRGVYCLIVGIFSASGGAYDSELWVDERLLAASWNRGNTFSSMLVQLTEPEQFDAFQQMIALDKRLTAHAIRESDFYAQQSKNTTNLITGVGILIGAIMAVGAFFAVLNSMHSTLSREALI